MAWRNIWRNRRRTLLTLSSIVFGIFLAVLTTAFQDQNWTDTINLAARIGGGHISLQHPDYLDAVRHLDSSVSTTTAARVDGETARIVREALERASLLLVAHRTELDSLTSQLCNKETVSGAEIAMILSASTKAESPNISYPSR